MQKYKDLTGINKMKSAKLGWGLEDQGRETYKNVYQ